MSTPDKEFDFAAAVAQLDQLGQTIAERRERLQELEKEEREDYYRRMAAGDGFAIARARDVIQQMTLTPQWSQFSLSRIGNLS